MDKQLFDMFNSRFDALDERYKTIEANGKDQLVLLQCIDKKVAVNAVSITWLKWSLRGAWTTIAASVGWSIR